jgi:hypothetical protein
MRLFTVLAGLVILVASMATEAFAQGPGGRGGVIRPLTTTAPAPTAQGTTDAPQVDPSLDQALTPADERMALLEATVSRLEQQIADLEGRLEQLNSVALTREGPSRDLRCASYGSEAINSVLDRTQRGNVGIRFYGDDALFPLWTGCSRQ